MSSREAKGCLRFSSSAVFLVNGACSKDEISLGIKSLPVRGCTHDNKGKDTDKLEKVVFVDFY